MSPSWKQLLVGIVVAVALSSAAAQSDAWCGCRGWGLSGEASYVPRNASYYCATISCSESWNSCGQEFGGCGLYAPTRVGGWYYTCGQGCGPATCGCTSGMGGAVGSIRADDAGKR
jgi:hypothetical protein